MDARTICASRGVISNVSERTSFWFVFPREDAGAIAAPDPKDVFGDEFYLQRSISARQRLLRSFFDFVPRFKPFYFDFRSRKL